MGAFLGISLWITLASVVPGLMTLSALYGASVFIDKANIYDKIIGKISCQNEWIMAGIALTVMVLTQALGILLESLLTKNKWLGPEEIEIEIPQGIDPHGKTSLNLKPYYEYDGLYILLSELGEDEDTQGHLKRCLAQFFLTNNSLVSFGTAIIISLAILMWECIFNFNATIIAKGSTYLLLMTFFFIISFKVAVIRFKVMALSLWAARRKRCDNGISCDDHIKKGKGA